jgi:hypothetical protein
MPYPAFAGYRAHYDTAYRRITDRPSQPVVHSQNPIAVLKPSKTAITETRQASGIRVRGLLDESQGTLPNLLFCFACTQKETDALASAIRTREESDAFCCPKCGRCPLLRSAQQLQVVGRFDVVVDLLF